MVSKLNGNANNDTIGVEVDQVLNAWRAKATHIVVLVVGLSALPITVLGLSGRAFKLVQPLPVFSMLLLGIILVAVFLPRHRHKLRAGMLLGVLAAFAFMQLIVTQLSGSGRLSLAALPLLALILIGPRTGWLIAALNMLIYGATMVMHQAGWLKAWEFNADNNLTMTYWILQGIRLFSSMLMLLVLMTLFYALQRRTLINERQARNDLEHETAARLRLEHEVTRVSEAERCKLGAELHDDLCQHLTAALLGCAVWDNQATTKTQTAEMLATMTRIKEMLEAALASAHNVARGLCPLCMDQSGLSKALARLCQGVQERDRIICQFNTDNDFEITDNETGLHLFRIASEAVTNAVKHAHCQRIVVLLQRESNTVVLSISDDGRGMPQDYDADSRLGCSIMAYRASMIGGTLEINSAHGKGTIVTCRIPLKVKSS